MNVSLVVPILINLPNSGTASDVAGIVSATIFRNTVNDSKIVTPGKYECTLTRDVEHLICITANIFAFTQQKHAF